MPRSKKAPAGRGRAAAKRDFPAVFARLKGILAEHAPALVVARDGPKGYVLETKMTYKGKPVFFGGARLGKAYVSYYLFPLYACPDLKDGMSPLLEKRMQGKTCFNFKEIDEPAFRELARLTRRGLSAFRTRSIPGFEPGKK
ncbi:hypothetical protein HY251_17475 [bacterium]|nr:hypothetical protein [bacterium]